jgi:TonB family protein
MDLNRAGVPQNVQVSKTSRDDLLDLAAIAAINAARPFPALPPQFTDIRLRLELTFSHNVLFGLDSPIVPARLPTR